MNVGEVALPQLLDIEQAAETLRVSKYSLYRWAALGTIPTVKLGSRLLFDRAELADFIEAHRRRPATTAVQAVKQTGPLHAHD